VLLKKGCGLETELQRRNLKDNGNSIVISSTDVLYGGRFFYRYGMVCPIETILPCKEY
jgi:hypothetical protein